MIERPFPLLSRGPRLTGPRSNLFDGKAVAIPQDDPRIYDAVRRRLSLPTPEYYKRETAVTRGYIIYDVAGNVVDIFVYGIPNMGVAATPRHKTQQCSISEKERKGEREREEGGTKSPAAVSTVESRLVVCLPLLTAIWRYWIITTMLALLSLSLSLSLYQRVKHVGAGNAVAFDRYYRVVSLYTHIIRGSSARHFSICRSNIFHPTRLSIPPR